MKETVLLICEDNSILSQMAEAFIRRYGWSAFNVFSAGIEPKPVHIYALQVMEEIGHDLYNARAKSIFELNHLQHVDYLITLSDFVNEQFIFNEQNIGIHLHWPFHNPLYNPNQSINQYLSLNDEDPQGWTTSDQLLLVTKKRLQPITELPVHENPPEDITAIRKRFRRVRDELEVQVMNWLEEKGIGPLWWRG